MKDLKINYKIALEYNISAKEEIKGQNNPIV